MDILRREIIYIWYYFSIQLEQVFFYWVMGMVIGSAISVFGKGKIHAAFQALGKKKIRGPGAHTCQSAGDRFPAVYVRYDPYRGVFLTERNAR